MKFCTAINICWFCIQFLASIKKDIKGWCMDMKKKGKRKVHGVPQSQTAAVPRHQEEGETDKTKQAQIEQMYEKH